jgi:hypothetical protein
MVMAADWMFYDQPLGWTLGLYGGFLMALLILTQKNLLQPISSKIGTALGLLLVAHMVYSPNLLSLIMFILCLATLLILNKRKSITDVQLWIQDIGSFVLRTFTQWFFDRTRISRLRKSRGIKLYSLLRFAVLPIVLTMMFSYLFTQANPIIADILQGIDFSFIGKPARWLFWVCSGLAIWGIQRPRFRLSTRKKKFILIEDIDLDLWLNKKSIPISLIVFNSLFALQNGLDAAFLWRGEPLPNDMNYAGYAHAGAYPLIFTTIIAAIYVLITFGENSGKYQSPLARAGVYIWIAQNIFLVISAMNRTMNYIEFYSLTHLRIAALIWMGLIATGMFLIVLRIYLNRSNAWLTNINALMLFVTLYICCFVNFNRIIADFNVQHSKEMTEENTGTYLDLLYLSELGPEAIPALERVRTKMPISSMITSQLKERLQSDVNGNWRAWTGRKELLLEEISQIGPKVDPRGYYQ